MHTLSVSKCPCGGTVDTAVSKTVVFGRAGSSPVRGTVRVWLVSIPKGQIAIPRLVMVVSYTQSFSLVENERLSSRTSTENQKWDGMYEIAIPLFLSCIYIHGKKEKTYRKI